MKLQLGYSGSLLVLSPLPSPPPASSWASYGEREGGHTNELILVLHWSVP